VLLVHGDADGVIPITAFHKTAKTLAALGFDLTTHISPGLGHSIDPVGLTLGRQFLAERQTVGPISAGEA
jgi:phospholipase/carboxylesterase